MPFLLSEYDSIDVEPRQLTPVRKACAITIGNGNQIPEIARDSQNEWMPQRSKPGLA